MCQYVADDGTVGDWHLVHLGSRAIGGAGLVMAEMTDVSRDGPHLAAVRRALQAASTPHAWKRVVDFIHRESPAKIGIQLGHAGRKGATQRLWEGDNEPLRRAAGRSSRRRRCRTFPIASQTPREMTRADMDAVRDDFVRATELATKRDSICSKSTWPTGICWPRSSRR